ncbi:MAG: hypothetical protein G01um101456_401 [Parcubacteria group bacterium Gr01-1014_56]|nr:MAG: hypothetical protein G01um101456_401 [Parcubacteria group bacterium Gr01-1014_56]
MSKEVTLILLGVWVAAVPHLGVPTSWKTSIFFISGLVIMLLGFFLRTEALARKLGQGGALNSSRQTFVENAAPSVANQQDHERKEGITSLN